MKLSDIDIAYYRNQQDDTALHLRACKMVDDECFKLYGTDCIGDYHGNYQRWIKMYKSIIEQVFPKKRI